MKITIKNPILAISLCALFASTIITGCESSAKKVEDAKEDVNEANKELEEAKLNLNKEVEQYKIETNQKIQENNKSIEEFNAQIDNQKKNKTVYTQKIAELKQKNTDMQKKIDEYVVDTKDNWEIFKTEFNRDMEELGKSFDDFTTNNTK